METKATFELTISALERRDHSIRDAIDLLKEEAIHLVEPHVELQEPVESTKSERKTTIAGEIRSILTLEGPFQKRRS